MRIIGVKIREACTPKYFKESIVRSAAKKFLKLRLIFQPWSGQPIDEVARSETRLILKGFGKITVS